MLEGRNKTQLSWKANLKCMIFPLWSLRAQAVEASRLLDWIVGSILFHEELIPLHVAQDFVVLWYARVKVEVKNRYLNAVIKAAKKVVKKDYRGNKITTRKASYLY